jgi:thioredoxin-like negative regulator of GroEL
MANRFNVKLPVMEDPNQEQASAQFVKEISEKDFAAEVTGAALPVAMCFYAKDSKPCEALAPRFAAVAGKFAGKVSFLKTLCQASPEASARLSVAATPTLVFFKAGAELGARLTGDDIKRTDVKARVEALLA